MVPGLLTAETSLVGYRLWVCRLQYWGIAVVVFGL